MVLAIFQTLGASRFRPTLRSVSGEQPRSSQQAAAAAGDQLAAEEEKRRSTGSISSLVRIWETTDGQQQLPAVSPTGQQEESNSRPGSVVKFEKRVWPPVRLSPLPLEFRTSF